MAGAVKAFLLGAYVFPYLMTAEELETAPNYVTGGMDGTEPGDIRTVLFLYAPANGRLMDWKFQNSDDYQGVTVHDGLVLAVVKVALKPGMSMASPACAVCPEY